MQLLSSSAANPTHVAECHSCAQDFVEREHCEELLAQIGFGHSTAAVLLRYVREHAGGRLRRPPGRLARSSQISR